MCNKLFKRIIYIFCGLCVIAFSALGYLRQTCIHNISISSQGVVSLQGIYVDDELKKIDEFINGPSEWNYDAVTNTYTSIENATLKLRIEGEKVDFVFGVGNNAGSVIITEKFRNTVWDLNSYSGDSGYERIEYVSKRCPDVLKKYTTDQFAVLILVIMALGMLTILIINKEKTKINTNLNGFIEFERFIFCLLVMLHHYGGMSPAGYLGVDFFFILSGFLLMKNYERENGNRISSVDSAWKYTISRYFRIIPHFVFTYILSIIILFVLGYNAPIGSYFVNGLWELLMLSGFGIPINLVIGPGWYCSSLLIAGFIVYLLLCYNKNLFIKFVTPVSAMLVFSWLWNSFGNINRWTQYDSFISTGTLRGFVEIGIGCLCFCVCKYIKEKYINNKYFSFWVPVIQILALSFVLFIILRKGSSYYDFFCVIIFAISIILAFTEIGWLNKVCNNFLFRFLGKISMSVFLNHVLFTMINWRALFNVDWYKGTLIYVIAVLCFSTISTIFVDYINNMIRKRGKIEN